jgi:hypothetical protein
MREGSNGQTTHPMNHRAQALLQPQSSRIPLPFLQRAHPCSYLSRINILPATLEQRLCGAQLGGEIRLAGEEPVPGSGVWRRAWTSLGVGGGGRTGMDADAGPGAEAEAEGVRLGMRRRRAAGTVPARRRRARLPARACRSRTFAFESAVGRRRS